jgi:hypothetical protein
MDTLDFMETLQNRSKWRPSNWQLEKLRINTAFNCIIKHISALDSLRLNTVFCCDSIVPRPSQFQVSFELIASKDLRGGNGLRMRAYTTGEYEVCVQAMMMLHEEQFNININEQPIYETQVRYELNHYNDTERAQLVKQLIGVRS